MLVTSYSVPSLYDHVHLVTGHPSPSVMAWHQENSTNAAFTPKDAAAPRPVCPSCAYGAMSETRTDHHRVHRTPTTIPGQQFALDAYDHTHKSHRRFIYCDMLTDLASGRIYPVFTKDRSAKELISQLSLFFAQYPAWQYRHGDTDRFIRLDSESNYRSDAFLEYTSTIGYRLERTPPRDKHANGIAERAVGVIATKTNIAMLQPSPSVPSRYWDLAMAYACDTHSFNPLARIGTSPYHLITGRHVDVTQLHPFYARCYVHIPSSNRPGKVGHARAYRAHFVGYDFTSYLTKTFKVIEVYADGTHGKVRTSKSVIFDQSINFRDTSTDSLPKDQDFGIMDSLPYPAPDDKAASRVRFSDLPAHLPVQQPTDRPYPDPPKSVLKKPPDRRVISGIHRIDRNPGHVARKPPETRAKRNNPNALQAFDEHEVAQYWFNYLSADYEFSLSAVETQHFTLTVVAKDPTIPKTFWQAMQIPDWAAAIDKERAKFEVNNCLAEVPFVNQHLVPMMWLFNIKTDGTKKARLVGRGDMMIPWVDFDPNAVYCGNVSASSIKIALVIAALYKLVMRGGDLVGAYLVTLANPDFPVHIKTPLGYKIQDGHCIQAVGNLYGFPPAGQNFSKEFDKCLRECGYENTPWDLKFFYKWINGKPIIVIAHSDDFRWFGPDELLSEWDLLVATFNRHKYEVTDATNKEFVGIHIYHDEDFNYYMDQSRMIDSIVRDANLQGDPIEKLPYPMDGNPLSKLDCATEESKAEDSKYPYRKVVGQLMYGMVHTMVTIMYALNVLSRYGNNPGKRHIHYLKHLVRYAKYAKDDRLKFKTHDGPQDIETMTNLMQLRFQCDADLGGNPDNKHSQTSYLGYLAGSLICWCSTDQGSVSTSTAESEIKAVNHTLKNEVIANRGILNKMGWIQSTTVIEEDNSACVAAAAVTHITRGLRHLDLGEAYFKEKTADKSCIIVKVASEDNNADIGN